jgi:hypothetical protein
VSVGRYVLAVDPGGTTGIVLWDMMLGGVAEIYELPHADVGFMLERIISAYRPDVVCEAFIITAKTVSNSQAPWSLKQLGVAEYLAAKYHCLYAQEQLPVTAKKFATNERLKALGLYVPGKGHATDAMRHLVIYLVRNGWWDPRLKEVQE